MSDVIGIDLGTTNTRVIAQRNGLPQIVINESGGYETPSSIVVDQTDGFLVGPVVRSRFISHPKDTIMPFRQLLGKRFDEIDLSNLHYKLVSDEEGQPLIEVRGRRYRPVALCAALLGRLAKDAVIRSDSAAQSVVLTMPPGADVRYRTALRQAVADAGLSLKVFIEDPVAAVLGCGLDDKPGKLIAVYDFGGESFSFSVVSIEKAGVKVRASERLQGIGSASIDRSLSRWMMRAFHKRRGINLADNPQAFRRLVQESERVRIMLSSLYETPLVLPFAADGEKKAHLATRVKRVQLERFTDSILRQTLGPCQRVFASAGIQVNDLSEVLVVGAPGRMPRLHEFVRNIFGRKVPITIAPPEAGAEGAYLSGAFMTGAINPTEPRPRKGIQLAADPARAINEMVERLRSGPDPTEAPSPKLRPPPRPEPKASPKAEVPSGFAFQAENNNGGDFSAFSFIEMTDEQIEAESQLPADEPTDAAPAVTDEQPAVAESEPAPPEPAPPEPVRPVESTSSSEASAVEDEGEMSAIFDAPSSSTQPSPFVMIAAGALGTVLLLGLLAKLLLG